MLVGGFLIGLLAFNVAFETVHGQFYVDIEHSLPRIGKRFEENGDNDYYANGGKVSLFDRWLNSAAAGLESSAKFHQQPVASYASMDDENINRNLETKALRFMKLFYNKKLQNQQQQQQQEPINA